MARIGVVGAGISGLVCARTLARAGHRVMVFEKSGNLGGRCATRKWEGHLVDHGAQYFTLIQESRRQEIAGACALAGLAVPVVDAEGREVPGRGERYYLKNGNNQLAVYLAGGLEVRLEHELREVSPLGKGWALGGEWVDAVVSSAPLPQTEALFRLKWDGAEYVPCLAFLYEYEGEWAGLSRTRYAVSEPSWELAWSACENHKENRIRGARTVFVVHASEDFSRKHLEADTPDAAGLLRRDLEVIWGLSGCRLLNTSGHRWRHARSRFQVDLGAGLPPGLFVTGDSQCESRIETVWEAGSQTAQRVQAYLENVDGGARSEGRELAS
jgi:predicted NAD/FAD-dependent oxidoreductase